MFKARERYNAKARQSVAGGKKRHKRTRTTVDAPAQDADPNAAILVPRSIEEKDAERRERLRQEVASGDAKMTSKKKKRLDKYIEKKLKQEERLNILKKLEKSQAEIGTATLQSSSTLGSGKTSTHLDRLAREEHKGVKKALTGSSGRRARNPAKYLAISTGSSESDSDASAEVGPSSGPAFSHLATPASPSVEVVESLPPTVASSAASEALEVGSALRRNADGSVAAPRVIKRKAKGKRTAFQSWTLRRPSAQPDMAEESDASFDSSDSANDTPEEAEEGENTTSSQSDEDSGSSNASDEGEPSAEKPSPNDEEMAQRPPAIIINRGGRRNPGAFKAWAMQQLSVSKQYVALPTSGTSSLSTPGPAATVATQASPPTKRRKVEHKSTAPSSEGRTRGPLGEELTLPKTALAEQLYQRLAASQAGAAPSSRSKAVLVERSPMVTEARLQLPVVAEEQPIMEAIMLNPVVVICGETGSGKTTQVPQFLYEAGFGSPGGDNPGMIGITQPRRVAAMSMASRVAHELSLPTTRVSYQIRYDATVSPSTAIKFMTDGVLLRELATDFLLNKYSVIIIDEAHERSLNTDILVGVLSRVVKLREEIWKEGKEGAKPLRLIIMSATLRVSDFTENTGLFASPPPVLSVAARQHPVTVHFSRRTSSDYIGEAVRKAAKIHTRLPPGGILVFLTGQNEIHGVCKKLEDRYGVRALEERRRRRHGLGARRIVRPRHDDLEVENAGGIVTTQADIEPEEYELGTDDRQDRILDIGEGLDQAEDSEALDSDVEGLDDEALNIDMEESDSPMHVVPLYSLLPSEKQMRVFDEPPEGARLVVVATNVAETSLTIPGIRYVIDCGRVKERRYDVANGIQAFQVSWISKASAAQRAGRAGRTSPGHCYRLYSSALYEHHFDQFAQPELLRVPIEGVVLQMKSMHIDAVANFPFPTPPDRSALRKAETVLTHLGALSADNAIKTGQGEVLGGQITELGRAMALFPVSPRYSRMLVSGRQHNCLPYVIAIVSALSVGDPFLREEALVGDEDEDTDEELAHITGEALKAREARKQRRKAFFRSQHTHGSLGDFMSDVFRVLSVVGAYEFVGGGHTFCQEHFVRPKAMEEIHKLRTQITHIVQTNFPTENMGILSDFTPPSKLQIKALRQLLTAAFIDQVAVRKDLAPQGLGTGMQYASARGVAYRALNIDDDVYFHPSSALFSQAPPDYVVFTEVVRTSRVWLKGITVINSGWLSALGKGSLCTFSKPVRNKEGKELVIPRFGPGWELPPIPVEKAR